MKSKVDYFDIKVGDDVVEVGFIPAHKEVAKDGRDLSQSLDIYKVVLSGTTKVYYLYAHEIEM